MYRLVFFNPRLPSKERLDPGPWITDPRSLLSWRDFYVREFGYTPQSIRFQVNDERGVRFVAEHELGARDSGQSELLSALASMA